MNLHSGNISASLNISKLTLKMVLLGISWMNGKQKRNLKLTLILLLLHPVASSMKTCILPKFVTTSPTNLRPHSQGSLPTFNN